MLKSSNRAGGIAARVKYSLHSRGRAGTVAPTSASRWSRATGLSLNLKLLTAPVTSPSSTRYTPSLVSPVSSSVCGSTSRTYHRQLTSRPRRVLAIRSSMVALPAAVLSRMRLSVPGVVGSPEDSAVHLVWVSAVSTPSRSQVTGGIARPLSNTEDSRREVRATTKGAHRSPAARGQVHLPPRPVQPPAQAGRHRRHVHVGEVRGGLARPGRPARLGRLGIDVDLAGRLVMAQPQPGGGTEEGTGQ